MKKYTIHFGVHAENVPLFAGRKAFITDHDGWNCWGEPLGEDVNDATTVHMQVRTNRPQELVPLLRHELRPILVQMSEQGNPRFNGTLMCVSDTAEWDKEYEEFLIRA